VKGTPSGALPSPAMLVQGEEHRGLHPAVQRSHDERCPSGSGWGSARSRAPERASAGEGTSRWREPSDGIVGYARSGVVGSPHVNRFGRPTPGP